MRQRVAIAIALLHRPDLIIADEPTTALDVTIQAQILAEVQSLCPKQGTALIWITHDLSVVSGLADDIAVMYAGRIVETGSRVGVLDHPLHPYTDGLIGSVPSRNRRGHPPAPDPRHDAGLLGVARGLRLPHPLPPRRRCLRTARRNRGRAGRTIRCFHPNWKRPRDISIVTAGHASSSHDRLGHPSFLPVIFCFRDREVAGSSPV